jgi:hypothetical protein
MNTMRGTSVLIETTVQFDGRYRTAEMDRLYTDDQAILLVDAKGIAKRAPMME